MDTEPPVVELDDDEKKINFIPKALPDLTPQVMAASYGKFTTPDEEEGFHQIRYEWQSGEKAHEYLKTWVLNKKRTTRIEDIKPGTLFKTKATEFAQLLIQWKQRQRAYNDTNPEEDPLEKPAHKRVDFDLFSLENIGDCGNGAPLYESFGFEDWALVQLRFELYILLVAFKTDADDSDRVGIPLDHLTFYYTQYFHRQLQPKVYGLSDINEIIAMIPDTVASKDGVLVSQLEEDMEGTDIFVKLAEEHRRERQRRIDAGDETARLKFLPTAKQTMSQYNIPGVKIRPITPIAPVETPTVKVSAPKTAKVAPILPSLATASSEPEKRTLKRIPVAGIMPSIKKT